MYLYFLIVPDKKYGAVLYNFLDFMDLPSQTYMKWPLKHMSLQVTTVCKNTQSPVDAKHTFKNDEDKLPPKKSRS